MNHALLKEVVSHVMASFCIIPSTFIDHEKSNSLLSPHYLLNEIIFFEEEGTQYKGKTWGCQLSVAQTEIKVILGECTVNPEFPEFTMVVQSKDSPIYGLYLCYNETSIYPLDSDPDLCVSLNGKDWMECTTYLQATFLAAMEQARDIKLSWTKIIDYKELYKSLLSFMNFHSSRFSVSNEG